MGAGHRGKVKIDQIQFHQIARISYLSHVRKHRYFGNFCLLFL